MGSGEIHNAFVGDPNSVTMADGDTLSMVVSDWVFEEMNRLYWDAQEARSDAVHGCKSVEVAVNGLAKVIQLPVPRQASHDSLINTPVVSA